MVGGKQPGQGAVIERDRNGRGERASAGQAAGYLAGRVGSNHPYGAGGDVGQEPRVAQHRARWAAPRQGKKGEDDGGAGQQQPPAPCGGVCVAFLARLGNAHSGAPSGSWYFGARQVKWTSGWGACPGDPVSSGGCIQVSGAGRAVAGW